MSFERDRSWDDDPEELNRQALERLLGSHPETNHAVDLPDDAAPVDRGFGASDGGSRTSPEPNPPNSTMPVGDAPSVTPTANTSQFQPQTFQGFRPNHAMEGFDFNREQNTGRSAKDAFAWLANQAPPPPLNDKQALAGWFRQYIEPGMNQLGHHVSGVSGDTFTFDNWQGQFTVDYGRGAGAENGALAWQVDPGTAQMPDNPQYQPQGPRAPQVSPVAPPMLPVTGGGDNQTAMDEILAEIEALMSGQGSPMDARALQGLLQ